MKKILVFIFSFSVLLVNASNGDSTKVKKMRYDQEQDQTLFKKGTPIGFYIGLSNKPSVINEQYSWMTGAEVSLVFNHRLNIGFAGYGLVSPVQSNLVDQNGHRYYYDLGYGGLLVEPVIFSRSLVHLTFPVLIGAGGAGLRPSYMGYYYNFGNTDWENYFGDAFFIAEPGVNLELNVFKWMRFHAGASYRFVSDGYFGSAIGNELSGWSANFGLKFGRF